MPVRMTARRPRDRPPSKPSSPPSSSSTTCSNGIKDKSDDHFDVDPERVDWGHVGTLNKHLADLREIGDAVFKEGEFAEPAAGRDGHAFNHDGRRVAVCVPTD